MTEKQWYIGGRNVSQRMMNPAELLEFEGNPKEHTESQVGHIAESVRRFGFTQPIVTDENSVILIGHGRVKAALRLGMTKVPVLMAKGLSEAQKMALVIADNSVNEETGFDSKALEEQYKTLLWSDEDWAALGLGVEQVGSGDKKDQDVDTVKEAKEIYDNAEVKQMVLYFLPAEYQPFCERMERAMKITGCATKAALVMKLLGDYERRI